MQFLRPKFHFTAPRGWSNDPNGLFFDGRNYHLYYQANPEIVSYAQMNWYSMRWGHAVSTDLLHWSQCKDALLPRPPLDGKPDCPWSGSCIVDRENVAGFGKDAVLAFFTSTARGECIAFSLDGGMTFTEYAGNPVVRHNGRDPKVFFHPASGKWIMAVFEMVNYAAFYSSENLRDWRFESRIHGFYECINCFELGGKWVLMAADGSYSVGTFDGHQFEPLTRPQKLFEGTALYAGQCFWGIPEIIVIFWFRLPHLSGAGFLNQMSLPMRLELGAEDRIRILPAVDVPGTMYHSPQKPLTLGSVTIPAAEDIFVVEDEYSVEAFLNGGDRLFAAAKIQ